MKEMYSFAESLLLWLVVYVCKAAFATVLSIEVGGHENTSATILIGTLSAKTGDLAILVNLKKTQMSNVI